MGSGLNFVSFWCSLRTLCLKIYLGRGDFWSKKIEQLFLKILNEDMYVLYVYTSRHYLIKNCISCVLWYKDAIWIFIRCVTCLQFKLKYSGRNFSYPRLQWVTKRISFEMINFRRVRTCFRTYEKFAYFHVLFKYGAYNFDTFDVIAILCMRSFIFWNIYAINIQIIFLYQSTYVIKFLIK